MNTRQKYVFNVLWLTASVIMTVIVELSIKDYVTINFIIAFFGLFVPSFTVLSDLTRYVLGRLHVHVKRMPTFFGGSHQIVETDVFSSVKNPILRGLANIAGDLGINIVFFIVMITAFAVAFLLSAYYITIVQYIVEIVF